MDLTPIQSPAEYKRALAEYEAHFDSEPELGSPEAERFVGLGKLLAAYEGQPTD